MAEDIAASYESGVASAESQGATRWMARLKESLPEAVEEDGVLFDPYVYVRREMIVDVLRFLRDDPELQFHILSDETCVDYLKMERDPRFEVVYHLCNLDRGEWCWLRVRVPESNCEVPTATAVFNSANWQEREIWDLFGIKFVGHPKLTKILTPDHLVGHPLRKDYDVQYIPVEFDWDPTRTYKEG